MSDALIAELARIDADQRRELVRAVRAGRFDLIKKALRLARTELLASLSKHAAAILIDDAVSGRRGGDRALKAQVVALLLRELGHLNDVPGMERIRQIIEKKQ